MSKGPASGIPAGGGPAKGAGRGGPARGYRWPPITAEDNVRRATHGARSVTLLAPMADALAAELRTSAPWCSAPAFAGAVASWCWAEAQAARLRAWLDEHGQLDDAGQPRAACGLLSRVEGRLIRLRQELGLTPQSLAHLLGRAASVARATSDERALTALAEEGQRILDARAQSEGYRALAQEAPEGPSERSDPSSALGDPTPVLDAPGPRSGPPDPVSGPVT